MRLFLLLLILAAPFAMCQQPVEKLEGEGAAVSNVTIDSSYFEKLREVVESSSDPEEKERAILTMAQIAVMLNDSERVVRYLKDVAMSSEDENVVAASYAAIDLIRDYYPVEAIGEMVVNVNGSLKPGLPLKIVATVKTYKDCSGEIGLRRIPGSFELSSDVRYKFEMPSEDVRDYVFELTPKESGEFVVRLSLSLSTDRFDHQKIEQKLLLKISESGGEIVYM